jgi:hypothetical protein
MGHWTNSSSQLVAQASGSTVVVFDTVITPGHQTILQSGTYSYGYQVSLKKPANEAGPSHFLAEAMIVHADASMSNVAGSIDRIEIDSGAQASMTQGGEILLSPGDMLEIHTRNDDDLLEANTVTVSGQCSFNLMLAGVPTAGNEEGTIFPPSGQRYNGQQFFRTDLNDQFTLRNGKWLGELLNSGGGRNGTQPASAYLRRYNGMPMSDTLGIVMPYDVTVIGLSWAMATGVLGDFQIRRDGVIISSVSTNSNSKGATIELNDDFGTAGVLGIYWEGIAACTNPQVTVFYRRRQDD